MNNLEKLNIISSKIESASLHHLIQFTGSQLNVVTEMLTKISKKQNLENDQDILIIDTDDNYYKVEELNQIFDFTRFAPMELKQKILVINNVDRLNEQCANKLLKVFEEPPIPMQIILNNPHKSALLKTIESRCISFHFDGAKTTALTDISEFKDMSLTNLSKHIQKHPNAFYEIVTHLTINAATDYKSLNQIQEATKLHKEAHISYLHSAPAVAFLYDLMHR